MSEFPAKARAVVIGCGIVGNSLVVPPHPARLDGRRPDRQGAAAEPRRLDRARVELHLPGRPLEGDDAAHARVAAAVHRDGRQHRVRRHRGRAHRGADGGAAAPDGVGEVVGRRLGAARHAGRDQGARAVHRRVDPARRLLLPDRLRRRLAARRHDHARAGDRLRRPAGVREHGRQRAWTSSTAASGACTPRAARSRPRWS